MLRAFICAVVASGARAVYKCTSDVNLPITKASQKGLALDDTTLHWCADQIPGSWPNTDEPVTSIRIFKAWQGWWTDMDKHQAWSRIVDFVHGQSARALVGTSIGCNEEDDDRDWTDVAQLIQMLGPDHVMGLAIGNEVDILWQEGVTADCVNRMWNGNYFARKFKERAQALDAMEGFAGRNIPVTTVLSEFSLAGDPFVEDPSKARVNSFVTDMHGTYGDRFVFTFNLYPYFDESSKYFSVQDALKRGTCFGEAGCLFADVGKTFRKRVTEIAGGAKMWIGETGWSSPAASTLPEPMHSWPEFSSLAAFRSSYERFLSWDLSLDGEAGPDHVFYFTMRDATAFGNRLEGFGLVGDRRGQAHLCDEPACKIQGATNASFVV